MLGCMGDVLHDRVKDASKQQDEGDRRLAALYAKKDEWNGLKSNYKVKGQGPLDDNQMRIYARIGCGSAIRMVPPATPDT